MIQRRYICELAIGSRAYDVLSPLKISEPGITIYLKLSSVPGERTKHLQVPAGAFVKQIYIWLVSSLISEAHDCILTCEASHLSPAGSGRSLACLNGRIDDLVDIADPHVVRITAVHKQWCYELTSQLARGGHYTPFSPSHWLAVGITRDHEWLCETHPANFSVQKALLHLISTRHNELLVPHSCPVTVRTKSVIYEWCTLSRLCGLSTMLALLQETGDRAICSHNPGAAMPGLVISVKATCYTPHVQINDVPLDYDYSIDGHELFDFGQILRAKIFQHRRQEQVETPEAPPPAPVLPKHLIAKQQPMQAGSVTLHIHPFFKPAFLLAAVSSPASAAKVYASLATSPALPALPTWPALGWCLCFAFAFLCAVRLWLLVRPVPGPSRRVPTLAVFFPNGVDATVNSDTDRELGELVATLSMLMWGITLPDVFYDSCCPYMNGSPLDWHVAIGPKTSGNIRIRVRGIGGVKGASDWPTQHHGGVRSEITSASSSCDPRGKQSGEVFDNDITPLVFNGVPNSLYCITDRVERAFDATWYLNHKGSDKCLFTINHDTEVGKPDDHGQRCAPTHLVEICSVSGESVIKLTFEYHPRVHNIILAFMMYHKCCHCKVMWHDYLDRAENMCHSQTTGEECLHSIGVLAHVKLLPVVSSGELLLSCSDILAVCAWCSTPIEQNTSFAMHPPCETSLQGAIPLHAPALADRLGLLQKGYIVKIYHPLCMHKVVARNAVVPDLQLTDCFPRGQSRAVHLDKVGLGTVPLIHDICTFSIFLSHPNLDLPAPVLTLPTQFDYKQLLSLLQEMFPPCDGVLSCFLVNRIPLTYLSSFLSTIVNRLFHA